MYDIDMRNLGQCCRDIRMAAKLSAEQLAKQCGIDSGPTVTRFETNQATAVTFTTLYKLLSGLAELDVVKHNDFDFGNYNPAVARLINSFKQGEPEQGYKDCKDEAIKYLYQNKERVSADVFEAFMFFVQGSIAFEPVYDVLLALDKERNLHKDASMRPPYTKLMCRKLEEDGDKLDDAIEKMIDSKTISSTLNYTHKQLMTLLFGILTYYNSKNEEQTPRER